MLYTYSRKFFILYWSKLRKRSEKMNIASSSWTALGTEKGKKNYLLPEREEPPAVPPLNVTCLLSVLANLLFPV